MNEREARGWDVVQQAIEHRKPLAAELNAMFSNRRLPGYASVVKGAMACLIKIVASGQASGAIARIAFADPVAMDIIRRTESRLLNDLDAALVQLEGKSYEPMTQLVSALASAATGLADQIRFAAIKPPAPAAFSEGMQANQFRGYAVQTVERDAGDEIVRTRTDYFGPGAPL